VLQVLGLICIGVGALYLLESLLQEPLTPSRRWKWAQLRRLGVSPVHIARVGGALMIIVGIALVVAG